MTLVDPLATGASEAGSNWIWLARALGSLAGASISLAYMLPSGRRDAALRFLVGIACGLTFGGGVGIKIAAELGVGARIPPFEAMLIGSAAASLCAWWALGFLMRLFTPVERKEKR